MLAPAAAIALAVRLLEAAGFAVTARNERGDSVYCRRSPDSPAIRVSNHARTPKQRQKHPDVVTSLVFRAPKTPEQVAVMVEDARRVCCGAAARRTPPDRDASRQG
ncbi:hypothetical protein [Methylobacterium haplocladii]|uniref:hypothetical protein n=1 Tax=Methylobacterium haplocladii TaxID=1176176 RepID=UPI001FCEADED|nr:hypothetical protein [Methylobacterium haplocladii]